jgi:hypothetical protein
MSTDTTVFRITQDAGFFHEINTLLIAFQGVAGVTDLIISGNGLHQAGDYMTIEGKHLNVRVRLPLFGPIQAALTNTLPDAIEITFVMGRDKQSEFSHHTSGFIRFVNSIFLPFLVAYHERYISGIKQQYPGGRTAWPNAWQMSWAIRNAASHNGRSFEKATQQAVTWRGLCFGPLDEPAITVLDLVNGGDLLALMIEMEEIRTGVSMQ